MEQWDLLDENGTPTGKKLTRGDPLRSGQYHLVEHIWIVDSKGRILIQRRADHLRLMPGVWAATGGSAISGEDSESAARRELFEELSIRTAPGELVYGGRMRRRNSFTDIWVLYRDIDPASLRLQAEEVAAVRWATVEELTVMLRDRTFHHYGSAYFQFVFRAIERGRRTLYVSDLDGTLLQNDQTISLYTEETLNRLISRGMLVSVSTARGTIGIELVQLSRIRFRIPLVIMGGVLLYDLYRRHIIHSCEMDALTVGAIMDAYAAEGLHPQVYRRRKDEVHIYYTELNCACEEAFIHRVGVDGRHYDRFFHQVDQLKVSPALFCTSQNTYAIQSRLKARLDGIPGITVSFYRDTYAEDNWFLEAFSDEAGKDKGVERLRQYVRASRVVAFGDNQNDIPLFRTADLACCVANGTQDAKAAADHIVLSNTEDGVARYLHSIYYRKL